MASPATAAGAAPPIFSANNPFARLANRAVDFAEGFAGQKLRLELLEDELELEALKRRNAAAIEAFAAQPLQGQPASSPAAGLDVNRLVVLGIVAVVGVTLLRRL